MNKKTFTALFILIILTIGAIMYDNSFSSSKGGDLSPETFKEILTEKQGVIIDVRTPNEYQAGHLAITDHQFDFISGEFDRQLDTLDKDTTYYLYCRTGNRSGKAMEKMQNAGFKEVYNIGGYEDLVSVGFDSRGL